MRGRVIIVHALFDIIGGAEFLALSTARALRESGYDVTVLTSTSFSHERIKNLFNSEVAGIRFIVKPVRVFNLLKEISHGRFARLRGLLLYNKFFKEHGKYIRDNYDLSIDTQSNLLTPVDIVYIHYPSIVNPYSEMEKGLRWIVYNWLVKIHANRLSRLGLPGRVLTNSTWTAGQIYRVYNVIADVVYPPVDVEIFNTVAGNDKRDKVVVTVSRFTVEKKLEKIVNVAGKLRDYTFILIGSTHEYSYIALDEIKRRIKEYGLNNIILEPNLPRSKLLEYLKNARYYLHPEVPEHFGIAVVEAMAAGCVPIVYRDGGAWYDVVSKVSSELGYRRIEEVVGLIKKLDENMELYSKLRERSVEVSKSFNYDNFKKSLLQKVEYVLEVKKIAQASSGL